MRRAFAEVDKDGSGSLDRKELKTLLRHLSIEVTAAQLEEAIDMIDDDDEGLIEIDEFLAKFSTIIQSFNPTVEAAERALDALPLKLVRAGPSADHDGCTEARFARTDGITDEVHSATYNPLGRLVLHVVEREAGALEAGTPLAAQLSNDGDEFFVLVHYGDGDGAAGRHSGSLVVYVRRGDCCRLRPRAAASCCYHRCRSYCSCCSYYCRCYY